MPSKSYIGRIRAILQLESQRFEKGLDKSKKKLKDFKKSTEGTTKVVAGLGSAVAGGAGIVNFIRIAGEFEKTMSRVKAITSSTETQFKSLENVARDLGSTTEFSASQAAEGEVLLAQAGLDVKEIVEALPAVLDLASVAQIELADSADIATNVMSGFRLEVSDLSRVVDVLAKASISTNTTVESLGESMKLAGPIARGLGLDFEETVAALGLFGNTAFKGTIAGNSLKRGLIQLLKPSADATKAMENAGISIKDNEGNFKSLIEIVKEFEDHVNDTTLIVDVFGNIAGPAMQALIAQGSKALEEQTNKLKNAGGTARQVAEVQLENLFGSIKKLNSAWQELIITLTPTKFLQNIVDGLTSVISKLNELNAIAREVGSGGNNLKEFLRQTEIELLAVRDRIRQLEKSSKVLGGIFSKLYDDEILELRNEEIALLNKIDKIQKVILDNELKRIENAKNLKDEIEEPKKPKPDPVQRQEARVDFFGKAATGLITEKELREQERLQNRLDRIIEAQLKKPRVPANSLFVESEKVKEDFEKVKKVIESLDGPIKKVLVRDGKPFLSDELNGLFNKLQDNQEETLKLANALHDLGFEGSTSVIDLNDKMNELKIKLHELSSIKIKPFDGTGEDQIMKAIANEIDNLTLQYAELLDERQKVIDDLIGNKLGNLKTEDTIEFLNLDQKYPGEISGLVNIRSSLRDVEEEILRLNRVKLLPGLSETELLKIQNTINLLELELSDLTVQQIEFYRDVSGETERAEKAAQKLKSQLKSVGAVGSDALRDLIDDTKTFEDAIDNLTDALIDLLIQFTVEDTFNSLIDGLIGGSGGGFNFGGGSSAPFKGPTLSGAPLGDKPVDVKVINNTNEKSDVRTRKSSDGGETIEVIIGAIVSDDIRNGGRVSGAISDAFDVRRSAR